MGGLRPLYWLPLDSKSLSSKAPRGVPDEYTNCCPCPRRLHVPSSLSPSIDIPAASGRARPDRFRISPGDQRGRGRGRGSGNHFGRLVGHGGERLRLPSRDVLRQPALSENLKSADPESRPRSALCVGI